VKNILLILDNALEFDVTRTILFKLGFNILSIKKGADMHARLKENFPDLVITSVLGTQDEMLTEFTKIREKRGIPKFIWVGPDTKMKKLSDVQKKVVDATLSRPVQPEQLIRTACDLLGLPADKHIHLYRGLVADSLKAPATSSKIHDPARAVAYGKVVQKIENIDKTFSLKEVAHRNDKTAGLENTEELGAQKKAFLKSLFKKT
jgi:CheY-like chemotaxis protein